MDVSVLPRADFASLTIPVASETRVPKELAAAVQPLPDVQVSILQVPQASPVYPEPLATLSRLRDDSHTGVAAHAMSHTLLSSLGQTDVGKAPFSVANVFSQISSLSKETTEYRNEARQFKVPQKLLTEKFAPDFTLARGKKAEAVSLSVRTRDGDSVHINMSRLFHKDGSMAIDFSFVVDGNLSEAEQKALGQLAEKLGQVSDTFFRTGTTELRGLQDVDPQVISGFNLVLERPKGDSVERHSYNYRVDEVAQTQTLNAVDIHGYSVDMTSALGSKISSEDADAQVLQQYMALIRQATDEGAASYDSQRFLLDAFASFFSAVGVRVAENQANLTAGESAVAAFDTGLPDFNFTFRSPVVHNRNYYSQASAMVLTMQQETRIETSQDNVLIKQENSYELINNRFEPLPGLERPDLENGNYLYVRQRTAASTSRILSMTNDRVNNLWLEQDVSDKINTSRFENHKLVDEDSRSYTDRNLQEFSALLDKYNDNKQQAEIEELISLTKRQLFLPATPETN